MDNKQYNVLIITLLLIGFFIFIGLGGLYTIIRINDRYAMRLNKLTGEIRTIDYSNTKGNR